MGKPLGTMLVFSITIAHVCAAVSLNGNGRVRAVEEGGHIRRGGELELRGCSQHYLWHIEREGVWLSLCHSVREH